MNTSVPDEPTHYRILVRGHLSPGWSVWFGGLGVATGYDKSGRPTTALSGLVRDQAELHGFIARIRDLGLPLLLVQQGNPYVPEDFYEPTHDSR